MHGDTSNHCRSDYTLGVAARMLLLDVCEPGCGYSDHDIPDAVWEALGVQLEAFLAVNAVNIGSLDGVFTEDQLGTHWVGSRTGAGIGFWSLALEVGLSDAEREALTRLDVSAKSQGELGMYAGDDGNLYLTWNDEPGAWAAAYEAARDAYVYNEAKADG